VFQQSCSSICDSANICVRTCVAASVFAFCVAASVYSFVLQHLCSHLCFSICVPTFVFQHLQRLLCVLHKQSIAINDNLNHLLHSSVMAIFPTEYTPTQPESVRKDLGSSYPPLYSRNLTMRIHVLKLNLVETTLLLVISEYH
jgi:hypothetical protein